MRGESMEYLNEFYEKIEKVGVIPVVVLNEAANALPLAHALVKGGLPVVEVTFRTKAAEGSIRAMTEKGLDILVGAGTVLNVQQAERAVDAGAKFIVSPGFDSEVIGWCLEHEVPQIPAGVTPTEVTWLVNRGLDVTKFFPATQYGGLAAIKSLASVFVGHRFMPTGGINQSNLMEYLGCLSTIACGGTWIASSDIIRTGKFDKVEQRASDAAQVVRNIRG